MPKSEAIRIYSISGYRPDIRQAFSKEFIFYSDACEKESPVRYSPSLYEIIRSLERDSWFEEVLPSPSRSTQIEDFLVRMNSTMLSMYVEGSTEIIWPSIYDSVVAWPGQLSNLTVTNVMNGGMRISLRSIQGTSSQNIALAVLYEALSTLVPSAFIPWLSHLVRYI